jgi:hypothetical protein
LKARKFPFLEDLVVFKMIIKVLIFERGSFSAY